MDKLWAFTITHKNVKIEQLGGILSEVGPYEEFIYKQLHSVKEQMGIEELYFLPTCNRILFIGCSNQSISAEFVQSFYQKLHPQPQALPLNVIQAKTQLYQGKEVVQHLFEVASSIDSLVVGEREIITQVRKAYENCKQHQLTGDVLRILIQSTIVTAKEVFTQTRIGENSVSVVSLAVEKLLENIKASEANLVMVGAGQSNQLAAKLLKKKGVNNFTIFNRSADKGQKMADELGGAFLPLSELASQCPKFDVLVSCTGSTNPVITESVLKNIQEACIIVDLAVPADVCKSIEQYPHIQYINIETLKELSKKNLSKRSAEIGSVAKIIEKNVEDFGLKFKRRKLEKAMGEIPKKIKAVKQRAYENVFDKEIEKLDDEARATLDKIVDYLEKKYIGIPIAIAKKALEEELRIEKSKLKNQD